MTGQRSVMLSDAHSRLVLDVVAAHLPAGAKLWIFGSRATGGARPYSDLDLALDAERPMTLDEMAILAEAFADSDLPFKVDIVDYRTISERFRQIIAAEQVPLIRT